MNEKLYNSKILDRLQRDNKLTVVWVAWKFKMSIPHTIKALQQIVQDFPEYHFNSSAGAIVKNENT